jgi:hypothetical protein
MMRDGYLSDKKESAVLAPGSLKPRGDISEGCCCALWFVSGVGSEGPDLTSRHVSDLGARMMCESFANEAQMIPVNALHYDRCAKRPGIGKI